MRWVLFIGLVLGAASSCGGGRQASSQRSAHRTPTKALHLGALPREGVAVETERLGKPTLTLIGLDGHVYGRLKLAIDAGSELLRNVVVVRSPNSGTRYVLDAAGSRLVAYRSRGRYPRALSNVTGRGCATFARREGVRFVLCARSRGQAYGATSIEVTGAKGTRRIAGPPPHSRPPPEQSGFWRAAYLSPDGRTVLAQWSADCETPTAFFAERGGGLRTVTGDRDWRKAPESVALGWSSGGRAVVQLLEGACGYGYDKPGVYLIDPHSGSHRLVYETRRSFAVMWSD